MVGPPIVVAVLAVTAPIKVSEQLLPLSRPCDVPPLAPDELRIGVAGKRRLATVGPAAACACKVLHLQVRGPAAAVEECIHRALAQGRVAQRPANGGLLPGGVLQQPGGGCALGELLQPRLRGRSTWFKYACRCECEVDVRWVRHDEWINRIGVLLTKRR